MATLIDTSYFVGLCEIDGLQGQTISATALNDYVQLLIDKYEPEYLKYLMGETLFTAYYADMQEYTQQDRFHALLKILVDNITLKSPIANYVFGKYFEIEFYKFPVEQMKGINQRHITVWNDAISTSIKVVKFINDNIADYPEFVSSEINENMFVSMNKFGI